MSSLRRWLLVGLMAGLPASQARAEEGLWTFEQASRPDVARRLGLAGDQAARERLRGNIVRFASGASGALVSARGLVVTVRSVAEPCLHAWSRAGTDYVKDGFLAGAGDGRDLGCPNLSLERLVGSEDVSKELRKGLGSGAPVPGDRIAALEQKCRADSALDCRVTALFDGAVMRLDRYRRHTDVKLVFAPEHRMAAFGPTSWRMNFPRQSLDLAFFRIYEQGKPLDSGPPIPWHAAGPADNEAVVVVGYPGETERYLPRDFLDLLGSKVYRLQAQDAWAQAQALGTLSRQQPEATILDAARGRSERLAMLLGGTVAVLQNEPIKRQQRATEAGWHTLLETADPKGGKTASAAGAIAGAEYAAFYQRYVLVEGDRMRPFGRLVDLGRKLLRWTEQRQRAEAERLPEYRGAGLASIERELSSAVPLDAAAEQATIATGLVQLRAHLGAKDPLVLALAGEAPAARAKRVVAATRLIDVGARKNILAAGSLGEFTEDPLLALVKVIEAEALPLRQRYQKDVQRHLAAYGGQLGLRLSAADSAGDLRYSNAGEDLRFSSGQVVGFQVAGRIVPAQTTMAPLVTRGARARPGSPWHLPARWQQRKAQLTLTTPVNFLTDADVGSGAPGAVVLNQRGQLVGMIIDITGKSAVNRFVYRGANDRAAAVHPAGVLEALRRIYDAGKLADELTAAGG